MTALLTQDLDHKVAGAIDHGRLIDEVRRGVDETHQFDEPGKLAPIAACRSLHLRKQCDSAELRGSLAALDVQRLAKFGRWVKRAICAKRHLAGNVKLVAGEDKGHIIGCGCGGGWQINTKIGESLLDAHGTCISIVGVTKTGDRTDPRLMAYHLKSLMRTSSVSNGRRAAFFGAACLFAASALAPPTDAAAAQVDLLSHRAVYELSLRDTERDSGIDFASGLFIFEVTGASCTGWTMTSDMILSLEGRSGNTIRTQTSYRAFEDAEGQVFTFQTNTETNEEDPVAVAGAAERQTDGELTIRRFATEQTTTSADAHTLFPNQLTEAVLEAALQDEPLMFSSVFDGSNESGLAQPVTAVIGAPQAPTVLANLRAVAAEGRDQGEGESQHEAWDDFPTPARAWPVTLSYFDPLEQDTGPDFIVSYSLDTNGVSDQLVLDYGAFTLQGNLADFQAFRPEPCSD